MRWPIINKGSGWCFDNWFPQIPLWSKKHSPITICNANKHLKPSQIAANKWSPQPLRPNKVAKALGFAHFDPVRILKMRTAEGVPRGTPIGGFFGSFLVRTRNERIDTLHLGPSRTPVPTRLWLDRYLGPSDLRSNVPTPVPTYSNCSLNRQINHNFHV